MLKTMPQSTCFDRRRYKQNGILNMLERNMQIKRAPERWQETTKHFDIVITFDQRVYDMVVEDVQQRESDSLQPVHIINLPVKDTHEEALIGAIDALQLMNMVEDHKDEWDDDFEAILSEFEQSRNRKVLHTLLFY
eukprot:Phypoly_transcript_21418.p1 GENE.Phypoly_transcript_21418~~Phypoly_transcript_21418.p1  ORF type:complete len:136 (+),score=12.21 Phypoly_transcript_21418:189-596(+)